MSVVADGVDFVVVSLGECAGADHLVPFGVVGEGDIVDILIDTLFVLFIRLIVVLFTLLVVDHLHWVLYVKQI